MFFFRYNATHHNRVLDYSNITGIRAMSCNRHEHSNKNDKLQNPIAHISSPEKELSVMK